MGIVSGTVIKLVARLGSRARFEPANPLVSIDALEPVVEELRGFGFVPAEMHRMRLPLLPDEVELLLLDPRRDRVVTIAKTWIGTPRVGCTSWFGHHTLRTNQTAAVSARGDVFVQSFPDASLPELLERHSSAVDYLAALGHRPDPLDPDELLDRCEREWFDSLEPVLSMPARDCGDLLDADAGRHNIPLEQQATVELQVLRVFGELPPSSSDRPPPA